MKRFNYIILILVATLSLSACGTQQNTVQVKKEVTIPPGKVLFFSKTCPHCMLVAQYVTENNIHQKIYFVERDITADEEAYQLLPILGQRCGLTESSLGVPFFWDGTKCYVGDENIINYFKTLP